MKKRLASLVFAAVTIAVFAADPIVKDGDMSGDSTAPGLDPHKFGAWYFDPRVKEGNTVSYDTSDFISKPQSLKIVSEGKNAFAMRQNLNLVPGRKYKISFQMKTGIKSLNGKPAGAVLNICDGVNRWFPSRWITTSTPWTRYEKIFIAEGRKPTMPPTCFFVSGTSTARFGLTTLASRKFSKRPTQTNRQA